MLVIGPVTDADRCSTYWAMSGEGARQDRSREGFEALYDRVARRLLVYLARRMHDVDAATELWAECWAVAFEGWPRCRAATAGEAEAWAFGIARHQLAGYYRSGAIRRRALERLRWTVPRLDSGEHEELERVAELDALRARLGEALADLSEKRRTAVQLRVVAGLPYRDVAARMGCSEQTARAHVSRGLRRLAAALDASDSPGLEGATR
jgi:RNA polymerase sigma factor (sigma-70 family)